MEHAICGADVSGIAVNLTASGLASMNIVQEFERPNIAQLEVGGKEGRTGSLELLQYSVLASLYGTGIQAVKGKDTKQHPPSLHAADNRFHFILMNPPYSASKGGPDMGKGGSVHRLFALEGVSEPDRKLALERARKLARGTCANFKAGLGTVFCAIAEQKLASDGRLGIVLPMSAATAPTWKKTRAMFVKKFSDVLVISITASSDDSQMSADTAINEILVIGRKGHVGRSGIVSVGLHSGLPSLPSAAETARAILESVESGRNSDSGQVMVGSNVIGRWIDERADATGSPWHGVGIKDMELVACSKSLAGEGCFPDGFLKDFEDAEKPEPLPMTTIGELFVLGPTHHLIGHPYDGKGPGPFIFHSIKDPVSDPQRYRSLWAANNKTQQMIQVQPTHYGELKPRADKTSIDKMLAQRSTLFYQRNMRWTSQALLAATTESPVFGGSSWVALLHEDEAVRFAFVIWANSLFGMLLHWSRGVRSQPGRSRTQIEAVGAMPVPDFTQTKYRDRAKKILSLGGDHLLQTDLRPACLAFNSSPRREIDKVALKILGWSPSMVNLLENLKKRWCVERTVHGGDKTSEAELAKLDNPNSGQASLHLQ